jgi:transcriptional regulator with XRE-family HTH domain
MCTTLCDPLYPGTREGFILVLQAPRSTDGAARRAEFADFLRTRRNALRPEELGLPGGGRRRTPGLRREEVAALAGVGSTWYTWLEQGRDVRASLSVLEAIAGALKLTPAERAHLIVLGRDEEPPTAAPATERLSPTIRRLVENLGANPACVLGRRWDYLAHNRAFEVVFGPPVTMPDGRANHLWSTFCDPMRRALFLDWSRGARRAVARFRADSAHHVGDPDFDALVAALTDASPRFAELWQQHEVVRSGQGRKQVRHPTAGRLVFEHAVFRAEDTPDQRLILYTPLPHGDTPAKLGELLR